MVRCLLQLGHGFNDLPQPGWPRAVTLDFVSFNKITVQLISFYSYMCIHKSLLAIKTGGQNSIQCRQQAPITYNIVYKILGNNATSRV